jgi:hypothetical protein
MGSQAAGIYPKSRNLGIALVVVVVLVLDSGLPYLEKSPIFPATIFR